ncbi:hypothetical protein EV379_1219 [Microterricola gilva]|uniref:Uncharacterized protein n=1 Tax=Microterricola gilva TaxID=393267 RepID=A0A4Q8AKI2_9MICO|nr:hypothetical protein [Microterricola gilva]RZU64908.1 hypothetical protein EV379_1219 [Microterricola gilva]
MRVAPKRNTDQWNADDFAVGSRVFTIAGVRDGTKEGPYDIDLVEGEGKCWRPPNTVIQLLNDVWGTEDSDDFIGRRVELYRDPSVKFGREVPGGIRVRAVSHIKEATTVVVQTTRGKRDKFTVQPLPTAPTQPTDTSGRDWAAELKLAGDDIDAVASLGKAASGAHAAGDVIAAMKRKWGELNKAAESGAEG